MSNTYNVRTYMPVTKNGVTKNYELAFGSGSEKSKDRMRGANCNKLGHLLETVPQMFTDEEGNALKAGQQYTEGYIGIGGNVVTVVQLIGGASDAVETITLPDGTVVELSQPASTGELPK